MQILGERLLVSRIEDDKKEGFQTVDVTDSFVYKGKIEQVGDQSWGTSTSTQGKFEIGQIVLFAKYSPDTQEVEHQDVKMKIIRTQDVLAIL